MSDFLKNAKETITETGRTIGDKTKQVGNVARLNARIISSEHSVSDNYTVLGKYYYDTHKDDPDESVAETVNAITASLESIADMKKQILAIKGLVKCVDCGADCPMEDSFCGKCGAKLEKPEPPATPELENDMSDEEILGLEEESDEDSSAF